MGWGCCCQRRAAGIEAEGIGRAAPFCPQPASPGGTIPQRSPTTGLLRRKVRTTSSELDRFAELDRLQWEALQASAQPAQDITMRDHSGQGGRIGLSVSRLHKWLGVSWPTDLLFWADLQARLQMGRQAFSTFAKFVAADAIPLPIAAQIFEAKVDSVLALSRWIWIGLPDVEERVNAVYEDWARCLLSAESWRNAAVAASEVGWSYSGYARVVKDAALRRARVIMKPDGDIYKLAFTEASARGVGWATRCKKELVRWNISPWELWSLGGGSYEQYKGYVDQQLSSSCNAAWTAIAEKHSAQVPYLAFNAVAGSAMQAIKAKGLPWDVLMACKAWFQLRAGLIPLRAVNGRRSMARHQVCIFCGRGVRNAVVHVLGCCKVWREGRNRFLHSTAQSANMSSSDKTLAVLACSPGSSAFQSCVHFCDKVVQAAKEFLVRTRTADHVKQEHYTLMLVSLLDACHVWAGGARAGV